MQNNPVCTDSIDSIGHEIKAINHILQRKMLSSASNAGVDKVTLMHGWIIGYLYEHRDTDVFQKDLEAEFAISRSTVTNILQLMERKGYIERMSIKTDARLKKIILTPKGLEINNIIRNTIIEYENSFDDILDDEERKTFLHLIRKLRLGLQNS